jgi:hypothetical protein
MVFCPTRLGGQDISAHIPKFRFTVFFLLAHRERRLGGEGMN